MENYYVINYFLSIKDEEPKTVTCESKSQCMQMIKQLMENGAVGISASDNEATELRTQGAQLLQEAIGGIREELAEVFLEMN